MSTHTTEPVLRVSIIRLPPVHDGMHVTAVCVLDPLRDLMGGIEMIMPKQQGRANHFPARRRNSSRVKGTGNISRGMSARPRMWPKFSRARGGEEQLNFGGQLHRHFALSIHEHAGV